MTKLNERLSEIQQKLKAPKSQYNKFGGFNYRSCEDILEAVKPLLKELTLTISDQIAQAGDRYYVESTAVLSDGDSSISVKGYAREAENKKGMDDSQITGATSSYARKYALNGLFAIDDTKDADTEVHTKKTKTTKKKEIPVDKAFRDKEGKIARDHNGHTACTGCGKVVSGRVESYSKDNYGKVLCMSCQAKEKANNARSKKTKK